MVILLAFDIAANWVFYLNKFSLQNLHRILGFASIAVIGSCGMVFTELHKNFQLLNAIVLSCSMLTIMMTMKEIKKVRYQNYVKLIGFKP